MDMHDVGMTVRDRLMFAWRISMLLAESHEAAADILGREHEAGRLFSNAAEDECHHAAEFRRLLREEENK